MVAFWDKQCEVYNKCLKSHPKRQEFDQLTALEEKLALDPDLFMDIYFLDRKTTPDALSFTKFDLEKVKSAADKVEMLYARLVGTGKNQVLRIGWNLHDVMHPSQILSDNAVRRDMGKMSAKVARMEPHHDYMERLKNMWPEITPSIVGSYHMEITGPGWKDELYRPDNMWIDIMQSRITDDVFEAMFDFGPALKGMMLISTDAGAIAVHSRIMDTMDFAEPEEEEYPRSAFLQGLMYAMKRRRGSDAHEAAFAAHKSPYWSLGDNRPRPPPTKYTAIIRGSHRVSEWAGDKLDTNTVQLHGVLTFKDSNVCEFDLACLCDRFQGVPMLSSLDGRIKGYKVPHYNKHRWEVPQLEPSNDAVQRMLEVTRDKFDLTKRKRADWGSEGVHEGPGHLLGRRGLPMTVYLDRELVRFDLDVPAVWSATNTCTAHIEQWAFQQWPHP